MTIRSSDCWCFDSSTLALYPTFTCSQMAFDVHSRSASRMTTRSDAVERRTVALGSYTRVLLVRLASVIKYRHRKSWQNQKHVHNLRTNLLLIKLELIELEPRRGLIEKLQYREASCASRKLIMWFREPLLILSFCLALAPSSDIVGYHASPKTWRPC